MELCAQSGRHKVAVIANSSAKVAMNDIMSGISRAVEKGLVEKVGEVIDPQEDGYAGTFQFNLPLPVYLAGKEDLEAKGHSFSLPIFASCRASPQGSLHLA
jgi:hypothetical protein